MNAFRLLIAVPVLAAALVCQSAMLIKDPPARKARLQLITSDILSPVALGVPGDGSNRQFI